MLLNVLLKVSYVLFLALWFLQAENDITFS